MRDEPRGGGLPVLYRIDRRDRIVEANEAWDAFALENGGEALVRERVLGTRLFDHVSGEATRFLVDAMLQCVRASGERLVRRYRCDSPGVRRILVMTLTPAERHGVELEHRILRIEPAEPAVRFESTKAWRHATKRCSLCNRIRVGGDWLEATRARRDGRIPGAGALAVYYGICGRCRPRYAF